MRTGLPIPAAHNPRSPLSLGVAFVGLSGIAACFLPFTWNVTPIEAADTLFSKDSFLENLWHLGAPLLLPMLVTVITVRWIGSGRLSRVERIASYLVALAAAFCLLSLFFLHGSGDDQPAPSGFVEWFALAFSWVGSAAGVILLWRNSRVGVPDALNAITAIQAVYAVDATFCLVLYGQSPQELQVGAYLVALTTLAYLVQILAASAAAPGRISLARRKATASQC